MRAVAGDGGTVVVGFGAGRGVEGGSVVAGGVYLSGNAKTYFRQNNELTNNVAGAGEGGGGGAAANPGSGGAGGNGGNAWGGGLVIDGDNPTYINSSPMGESGTISISSNWAIGGRGGDGGSGSGASFRGGDGGNGGNSQGGGLEVSVDSGGHVLRLALSTATIDGNQAEGGGPGQGGPNADNLDGAPGTSGAAAGGGLFATGQWLLVINSTFSNNTAQGGAGGLPSGPGGIGSDGGAARGGGLFFALGGLAVVNDTFSGDTAQGGAGAYGAVGGDGQGGAIYLDGSNSGQPNYFEAMNDTISGNSARVGAGGPGVTLAQGGGIDVNYRFAGEVRLINTIAAGNQAADGPDLHGNVTSSDHDLIGDGTGFFLWSSTGDLIGGQNGNPPVIDPLLNPLGFYGGPTQTMPEKVDSPAIDAGDDIALFYIANNEGVPMGQTTDQRGQPRLFGAHIDIGATEARVIKLKPVHGGSSGAAPPGGHHPGLITGAVNLDIQEEVEAPTSTRRTQSRGQSGGMSGVSIFPVPFDLGPALLDFQGLDQIPAELPPTPIHPPQPTFPLFPLVRLHLGDIPPEPPEPFYPPEPT
jgi:hypothetical protein